MNYYWIRVFEYSYEKDGYEKGTLLDEFYLKGEDISREAAKKEVQQKYDEDLQKELKFAKPRKKDGLYAIVMDSDESYYNWKYNEIDTYCFYCHKKIIGFERDFSSIVLEDGNEQHFCSYDCKNKLHSHLYYEGEFQEKESISDSIVGYIYHMYNRVENKHYIGQTKYLPFFRWQEHIKSGGKGNITEITFDVITEVRCKYGEDGQERLNNAEAWWIQKYIEEGYEVFNISVPKLSLADYQRRFAEMVAKESQLKII
ncbi:GIY-YIG nuclease family protein [Clostridium neonatale]|uniref:hypothetical protein n=1 Tax=Clostridium neonatale TaxID=137838 RepID=UPI00291B4343|nr:Excinuclease ABC C subunit domain protein [Clostridium neonatale]